MKEYIEREALIKMVKEKSTTRFDWSESVDIEDLIPAIKDIPAADVAPVRHGEWKIIDKTVHGVEAECSECKYQIIFGMSHIGRYCPDCGAIMDGGNK